MRGELPAQDGPAGDLVREPRRRDRRAWATISCGALETCGVRPTLVLLGMISAPG